MSRVIEALSCIQIDCLINRDGIQLAVKYEPSQWLGSYFILYSTVRYSAGVCLAQIRLYAIS